MRDLATLLRVTLIASLLLAAGPAPAQDDAAVAAYVDLSIERLELVLDTLEQRNRVPDADEEAELFARHGTDAESYYSFGGAHREELERYLEGHAEKAERIESLSRTIESMLTVSEEE